MLKFLMDHKGSVSIFTLVILIPVMVFTAVLMDFARLNAIKAQAAATAETYANSYLSVYDELLDELYGLFATTQSEDGKKAVDELKNYMKTAYNTSSSKTNTGLARQAYQYVTYSESYKNGLNLTGNALDDLNATNEGLKSLSDKEVLQNQISEYVKFIGPTELVFNVAEGFFDQFKTNGNSDKDEQDNEKKKKELDNIQRKNKIDKDIAELQSDITKTWGLMLAYDMAYQHLFDEMQDFATNVQKSYLTAGDYLMDSYEWFEPYVTNNISTLPQDTEGGTKYTMKSTDEPPIDSNNLFYILKQIRNSMYINNTANNINGMNFTNVEHYLTEIKKPFDITNVSQFKDNGSVLGYMNTDILNEYAEKNFRNCNQCGWKISQLELFIKNQDGKLTDVMLECKIQEKHLCIECLKNLKTESMKYCREFNNVISSIRERIKNLISDARAIGDTEYADGLEKDYAYLMGDEYASKITDEDKNKEQELREKATEFSKLAGYDFKSFADWYEPIADSSINKLQNDFDQGINFFDKWDTLIRKMIIPVYNLVCLADYYDDKAMYTADGSNKLKVYDIMGYKSITVASYSPETDEFTLNYDNIVGVAGSPSSSLVREFNKEKIGSEEVNKWISKDYNPYWYDQGHYYQSYYTKQGGGGASETLVTQYPTHIPLSFWFKISQINVYQEVHPYYEVNNITIISNNTYLAYTGQSYNINDFVHPEVYTYAAPFEAGFEISDYISIQKWENADQSVKIDGSMITVKWKDVYNVLRSWQFVTTDEKAEEEKTKSEGWVKALKAVGEELCNGISIRGDAKILPGGTSDSTPLNEEDSKMNVEDLAIADSDASKKASTSSDAGTELTNKLLLLLYDYGMFTCQTSDLHEDPTTGKVVAFQPTSYTGVALAEENPDATKVKERYLKSETNYLLYNELEYILHGSSNEADNFIFVRNYIAAVRFVPNYIYTYTITQINDLVGALRNALAACPLAAVIVCQALRLAIAGIETWADLYLLYGGYNVLLVKENVKQLSIIKAVFAVADTVDNEELKKSFDTVKSFITDELKVKKGDEDKSGTRVSYKEYLLLAMVLFGNREQMLERTKNLIEVNMNYTMGAKPIEVTETRGWWLWKSEKKFTTLDYDSTHGSNAKKWDISKAKTAVTTEITVNMDYAFIGDGVGSLFNTRDYISIGNNDNKYKYTVYKEY